MHSSQDSLAMPAGRARVSKGQYFLFGIVLLALGLRLARLTFQPLWWDEGWSVYFATTPVENLMELTAVDIHPPLYYLLLHLWIGLVGAGPLAVRLLSALVGTATIPLLYLVGKRLFGTRAGVLAALLLAISPFHIYYSQEVRMYGLVTLLGLAAFGFALHWEPGIQRSGNLGFGAWAGYVVAATAALYTQYYAVFLLLALNLAMGIRWIHRPSPGGGGAGKRSTEANSPPIPTLSPAGRGGVIAWLGTQAAVVVFYFPWLWYAGNKLLTYVRFKVGVEQYPSLGLFTYLGRHLAAFTWGHAEGALAAWWWLGLLPLALFVIGVALSRRTETGNLRSRGWAYVHWPLVISLLTLICGFLVNIVLPFNPPRLERLLLLALPAYLLLIAAGLVALWSHRRPFALATGALFLATGLVSLAFFYAVPRYPADDYRPVAGRLSTLALPTDAVVCVHPWQVGYFESYLSADERRPTLMLTPREVIPQERQLWAADPARMAADLDTLLVEHGRLWLPAHQAMGQILENQMERYLAARAYPVLSEWHGNNTLLSLYAAGEPAAQPATAHFGDWLALEGATLSPGPLEAGWGVVTVDLAWLVLQNPEDLYTVGLRLVGPTGHVWAQRDAPPNGGFQAFSEMPTGEVQPDHHGLLVPAGTPPGDYRLTLRVYRSADVSVLPVSFPGGSGGEVTLGTVRVVRPAVPPPVEALSIAQPLRATYGPLAFLGFDVYASPDLLPGEMVDVDLFWQALADPGEDFLPHLQLLDASGEVWAELAEKPVAGAYPTAWWRAGELVRDPHALPIPAQVPPGHYQLVLSLVRAADGRPVEPRHRQTAVELDQIQVVGREHSFEPTAVEHAQAAGLSTSVELTGYDLQAPIASTQEPVSLVLHWHALETPGRDYYAFVHLLDEDGNIVAQDDGPPGDGDLPTLGWLPGEYLLDPHLLQIPFGLPPGPYRLAVGLYDPATNFRLGDRIMLDTTIQVMKDE
jgi:hypothetical protein